LYGNKLPLYFNLIFASYTVEAIYCVFWQGPDLSRPFSSHR
jgi:hypothetical protein